MPKKKKPEFDVHKASCLLTGVAMHLRIIHKRSGEDMSEPIEAIEELVQKMDDYVDETRAS